MSKGLALAFGLLPLLSAAASAAQWVQTTVADFNAGTASSAAVVGQGGGAVRLHGSPDAWSGQTAPSSLDFYGVHMLSTSTAWAAGKARLDAQTRFNVAYYNGGSWSEEPTWGPGYDLYNVWMMDTGYSIEGWAPGGAGRVIGYDRPYWFVEMEISSHPADFTFYGVHMLDNQAGWAVGAGGAISQFSAEYWSWEEFPSPTTTTLYGVFTVSQSDAWAVGKGGVILRYNGSAWNVVVSPSSEGLWSMQMMSPTDGWIVGDAGSILRYNGTSWSQAPSPITDNLRSVSMPSSSEGWAVGYSGKIARWDGSAWTGATSPTGEALTGVSCASAERCLAVGYSGTFLQYRRDYVAVGTFTSVNFDGGSSPVWGALSWTAALPSGAQLKFQVASSNDAATVTDFRGPDGAANTYYTSSGTDIWSGHDGQRYLKYRAVLSTDGPLTTPYLQDVTIAY